MVKKNHYLVICLIAWGVSIIILVWNWINVIKSVNAISFNN
ncbi:MAG: hypothetical protein PHR00_02920 [Patescibacteria group bacterium]|nr:hypothetical protein [Patescibacteria group bacterium]